MTEPRTTTLQIQEHGPHTVLTVAANEDISLRVSFEPKKFEDPQLSALRKIIENQRAEITNLLDQNSILEEIRQEAKRPKKARR